MLIHYIFFLINNNSNPELKPYFSDSKSNFNLKSNPTI